MSKSYIEARLPKELEEKILSFQKRYPTNQLPYKYKPHITVKASLGLTDDMEWLMKVKEVCSKTKPFVVKTDSINTFGDFDVVYLNADSPDIKALHKDIVNQFNYSKEEGTKFFELELYNPHISLGVVWDGMSKEELKQLKIDAINEFQPYPSFMINELTLLQKVNNEWSDVLRIPLLG